MNAITVLTSNHAPASGSMNLSTMLRAYCVEAKFEFLRMLRTPAFAVPMLVLPIMLYVLFAALIFGENTAKDPQLALYMFASYVVFAATTPGMFGFGTGLAVERQSGMLRLKRALPMPIGCNLVAKVAMSLAVVLLVVSVLIPLASLIGHVTFTPEKAAAVFAVAALGGLTSCAIGFFIGSMVSGTAAPGVVNLIYFPMMYLSGMFFPLPKLLANWVVIWPTFYMDQLVIAAGGGKTFIASGMCIGLLCGLTVLFGGLAVRSFSRRT